MEVQTSKDMVEEEHKIPPVILENKWFFNEEKIVDISKTFVLKRNALHWQVTLHIKISVTFVPYLLPYKKLERSSQAYGMVNEMLLMLFHSYLHRIVEAQQMNVYIDLLNFETTKFFGAGTMKTFTEFGFTKNEISEKVATEYDTNKVIQHNSEYDKLLKENSDKLVEVMFIDQAGENICDSLKKSNLYFWPEEKEQKNALFVKSPVRFKKEFEEQYPTIPFTEIFERYVRYLEMYRYEKTYNIKWLEKDFKTIFEDKKNETLEKLWKDGLAAEKYEEKQTESFAALWGGAFGLEEFEEKQEEQASTSTTRLTPAKRKLDEDTAPGPTDHFSKLKKSHDSTHKIIQLPYNSVFFSEYKDPEVCYFEFTETLESMKVWDVADTDPLYWGEIEITDKDKETLKETLKEIKNIEEKSNLDETGVVDLKGASTSVLHILCNYLSNNIEYVNENYDAFGTSKIDKNTIESFKPGCFVDEAVLQKCVEFIYNKAKERKNIEFTCIFGLFNTILDGKELTFEEYFTLTCKYINSILGLEEYAQIATFREESHKWCPVIIPIVSGGHIVFIVVFPIERVVFIFDSLGSLRVDNLFAKYQIMLKLLDFIYYGGEGKDWRISHEIPRSIQNVNDCGICAFLGIRKILTGEGFQVKAEGYNRYVLLREWLKATRVEPCEGFFSDIGYEVADD